MDPVTSGVTRLCLMFPFWRIFPCNDVNNGDARWPAAFPEFCAGQSQSPINLRDDIAINVPSLNLAPFVFNKAYHEIPRRMVLVNTGTNIFLESDDGLRREVSGGGLEGHYILHSVHLHLGRNATSGSDHWLNGRSFATEIHFVHYRSEFRGLLEALQSRRRDALAVFGVFYDASGPIGPDFADITKALSIDPSQLTPLNRVQVTPFSLMRLMPVNQLGDYFRYYGGLTSPPCNEVVTWTVFRTPVRIRQGLVTYFFQHNQFYGHEAIQMDEIFSLMQNLGLIARRRDPMSRRPQPLNGRAILRSVPQP